MKYESDGDGNCDWCVWKGLQKFGKETGRRENQRKETRLFRVQNTPKSPGDMRRFAVTQTLRKDYQITMAQKTRKEGNNYYKN